MRATNTFVKNQLKHIFSTSSFPAIFDFLFWKCWVLCFHSDHSRSFPTFHFTKIKIQISRLFADASSESTQGPAQRGRQFIREGCPIGVVLGSLASDFPCPVRQWRPMQTKLTVQFCSTANSWLMRMRKSIDRRFGAVEEIRLDRRELVVLQAHGVAAKMVWSGWIRKKNLK